MILSLGEAGRKRVEGEPETVAVVWLARSGLKDGVAAVLRDVVPPQGRRQPRRLCRSGRVAVGVCAKLGLLPRTRGRSLSAIRE